MSLHSLSLLSRSPKNGRIWLGVLFDRQQVCDLAHLAEDLGRAFNLHRAVKLVEAEPDQRRALGLVATDRRSGLGNLQFRHFAYSVTASAWASASAALAPPRPSRSETFLPRR